MTEPPRVLGQIIAERELILSPDRKVTLRIGLPVTVDGPPSESWCPYQIEGLGSSKVRHTVGIDAFQSIWLAMQMIGSTLYESQAYRDGRLGLEGARRRDPDLGLPVFPGLKHLVSPTPPKPE